MKIKIEVEIDTESQHDADAIHELMQVLSELRNMPAQPDIDNHNEAH